MTTTERLLDKYNKFSRRPLVTDPKMRKTIFKSFTRSLGKFLPREKDARILDVACGEGALLYYLRENRYVNLSGFDLSDENVMLCHSLGLDFVEKYNALKLSSFTSQEYQMILAIDIIEHLPKEEVIGFIDAARDRLSSRGKLIVQTPNMGSVFASFYRYNDLSHEFGLTEKTAMDLFMIAGFEQEQITIYPVWNATTFIGYLREFYQYLLHKIIFMADDSSRPRISTKNLLIVASRN